MIRKGAKVITLRLIKLKKWNPDQRLLESLSDRGEVLDRGLRLDSKDFLSLSV